MKLLRFIKPIVCTTFLLLSAINGYGQTRGTVDGGGANGLSFKLMESFKTPSEKLPKGKYIAPFINFLVQTNVVREGYNNNKISLLSYSNAMGNLLKKKLWFKVPTSKGLEDIGTLMHGIPFVTDQFAIQTVSEVYIDEKQYDQMVGDLEEEREKLILHELFMGLKVLMRQTAYINCLYSRNAPDIVQTKDYCSDEQKESINQVSNALDLKPQDHSDVRFLTDLVIQNVDNFKKSDKFQELVVIFTQAFYERGFVSQGVHPYRIGSEKIAIEKIKNFIQGKEILKDNILYCGHSDFNNYSEENLRKLQEKWDKLPSGAEWSLKAKYRAKLVALEKKESNVVYIYLQDMKGKILNVTAHDKASMIVGFRLNKDYQKSVLSRDNDFSEFYLKDTEMSEKMGDKNEGVVVELNWATGELARFQVYDAVTYNVGNQGGSSARWFTKIECTNKEIMNYKKP